jgi:hypothetical protein
MFTLKKMSFRDIRKVAMMGKCPIYPPFFAWLIFIADKTFKNAVFCFINLHPFCVLFKIYHFVICVFGLFGFIKKVSSPLKKCVN